MKEETKFVHGYIRKIKKIFVEDNIGSHGPKHGKFELGKFSNSREVKLWNEFPRKNISHTSMFKMMIF